ncbi:hypothetical protein CRYO30217_03565 [Parvicella tangerina]|uniref:Uncharacterized protein n=1 Tax=Parvicella tangerina TaxID=2829795 RepID=A0A916NDX1_9FLAO|nr:hypothetical protein CRYO30217_03565 [Parvicella tangerina]
MCWEKPKVLKYAAGFQLVGNGLQLKEVAVLEHSTVYTHQILLVAQLFIFALPPPFFLGAVIGRFLFFFVVFNASLPAFTVNKFL